MRRYAIFAVKVLVTAGLLYFAIGRVNLDAVGDRLYRLQYAWMLLAMVFCFVQLGLVAVRWRVIAERCDAPLDLARSFRFSVIAVFFNQVLPSTVGGDAVRVWLLARQGAGWRKATYSVLLDRFVGVLALALLVAVTLPWSFDLIKNPIGRITLMIVGVGSIAAALCFLALGLVPSRRLRTWAPTRHLLQLSDLARKLLLSVRDGVPLMALSLTVHLFTAGVAWCAARAIAAEADFFQVLLLVTPVTLISTIPVSIAGWGVRESALVLAFTYAGLPPNEGLVISVLFGAALFVVGLIGGLTWLLQRQPLDPPTSMSQKLSD